MFKFIRKSDQDSAIAAAIKNYLGIAVVDDGNGVYTVVKPKPETGDYADPIKYATGDAVTSGLWYWLDDPALPHEAVASGTPSSFYDRNYFDFVEDPPDGY